MDGTWNGNFHKITINHRTITLYLHKECEDGKKGVKCIKSQFSYDENVLSSLFFYGVPRSLSKVCFMSQINITQRELHAEQHEHYVFITLRAYEL